MPPPLAPDRSVAMQGSHVAAPVFTGTQRSLLIVWPAFVMAGVLEMLVFAVVDPATLRWFGGEAIDWSASTVYSVSFLIFWAVITTAGAVTELLREPEPGA